VLDIDYYCWFSFRVMLIHLEQVYFQTNFFDGMKENFRILLMFLFVPNKHQPELVSSSPSLFYRNVLETYCRPIGKVKGKAVSVLN
jgi:hypothetical protein